MKLLTTFQWPGNVRELRNEIVRAHLSSAKIIQLENLSPKIRRGEDKTTFVLDKSFDQATSDFERKFIEDELKRNNYNISATARQLKMGRMKLTRLISKLKVEIPK